MIVKVLLHFTGEQMWSETVRLQSVEKIADLNVIILLETVACEIDQLLALLLRRPRCDI